jgi:peptidyl-prolyl cis-trans isomerase B (cyclophilin B)
MSFSLQHPHWRSLARLFATVLCLMMLSPGVSATGEAQLPNQQPEESMNQNPTFTITMKSGQVLTGELYPQIAPESVGNFIALANASFYDGLIFHRVIPGFMIQGGCPDGTGMGGPGYAIKGEFSGNGVTNSLKHTRGVLSMARSMRMDSAGSQFFIMVADAPHLDGSYAAFGKVLTGMEAADQIVSARRNNADRPFEDQVIQSIRVETYGVEYPFTRLKQ